MISCYGDLAVEMALELMDGMVHTASLSNSSDGRLHKEREMIVATARWHLGL
jgi:hypothetical protein